ncbi:OB fold nucleic acid binding domain [Trypanosoma vivax]|uniref:Putative replication Factor A 28 kDa subunit n=1 Tax=Trypanosoma vivax (strain Y486) TaxID=1055687 RepID=G0TVE5_TRYVY|nr:putative replication Factor A 28 kDa subunit [Trypanosoma vivax]KAH8617639.1 OB fold nucleic acid binding domain [Trypanosoma vivax]CCC47911.1 putative replication Factor A 28 kDa subunit [Trypanosoma vivax Y486]
MSLHASGFFGAAGGHIAPNSGNVTSQPQRRMHPIRPVTIKQLLEAQRVGDGVTVIDEREVTQATVVGRVVGYEDGGSAVGGGALTAKHHGYRITDGTGFVVVRQWMDSDQQEEPLPLQCYVRAAGTVKMWQNAPIVTGTVRLVSDNNELNYHFLDVILTHLRLTRGDKKPSSSAGLTVSNTVSAVGLQNVIPGGENKLFATDVLLNTIRQKSHGDVGLSMDELTAAAQPYGFNAHDVRMAMRTLTEEGKVYQTHDHKFNI